MTDGLEGYLLDPTTIEIVHIFLVTVNGTVSRCVETWDVAGPGVPGSSTLGVREKPLVDGG